MGRGGGATRAASTPEEQLLAIFDVFDEWFHAGRLRGLLVHQRPARDGRPEHPAGAASVRHLENIRSIVRALAEEAGLRDPDGVRPLVAHPDEGLDRRRRPRATRRGAARQSDGALLIDAIGRDRLRHERHARPVDEVRVGRRVEHDRVGAGAGREVADVVAAQRPRRRRASRRASASSAVIRMSRTASAMQNAIEVV